MKSQAPCSDIGALAQLASDIADLIDCTPHADPLTLSLPASKVDIIRMHSAFTPDADGATIGYFMADRITADMFLFDLGRRLPVCKVYVILTDSEIMDIAS